MSEEQEPRAYTLALRYLGVRQHSRREFVDYLRRKDCSPEEIEEAIGRLEELGLVDDGKFADAWVADRMAIRPRSRARLAQELAAKGVDRDTIQASLANIEPEGELGALKKLIERKRRAYTDEKKLTGYLQRQGYRWDLIKEAIAELESESG